MSKLISCARTYISSVSNFSTISLGIDFFCFSVWRYSITKAFCIAFVLTFFSVLDVPVFWPILVFYWVVLFTLTMRRQIRHMLKYKYLPFSFGKQVILNLAYLRKFLFTSLFAWHPLWLRIVFHPNFLLSFSGMMERKQLHQKVKIFSRRLKRLRQLFILRNLHQAAVNCPFFSASLAIDF